MTAEPSPIPIKLSAQQCGILSAVFLEAYGGYAGEFLPGFLNSSAEALEVYQKHFKNLRTGDAETTLLFPQQEWRSIFDTINAVLYELGPEELETITGYSRDDVMNTARVIYANAYKRYGQSLWP